MIDSWVHSLQMEWILQNEMRKCGWEESEPRLVAECDTKVIEPSIAGKATPPRN